jgi:tetratricopeptide (TPR) repeat protein
MVSPLRDYPLTLPERVSGALLNAHAELVVRGSSGEGRRLAEMLLAEQAGLHPAVVLLAEADLAERRWEAARDRLLPVVAELPTYGAAQVVLGRALEQLGELPEAYAAFRAAPGVSIAGEEGEILLSRVGAILENRMEEALAHGRLEDAASELARLEEWLPDAPSTLEARRRFAAAEGDSNAELAALRRLAELGPSDREILLRLSDLELEVGEPAAGLRILQDLAAAAPQDAELSERLSRARFSFRVALLPPRARDGVSAPELTRGQFAALLYWLFPSVRYGRSAEATIANDVFDDPAREEIVRVANQGLMAVDPTLHLFAPGRPVVRVEVLGSLLRLLDRRQPPLACLGPGGLGAPSVVRLCELAERCGLVPQAGDCLPEGRVSGPEAVDLSRRALEQLGID